MTAGLPRHASAVRQAVTVAVFVTADGAHLHYDRRGDGPPLVLVHGSATTHRCFDLVVEAFAIVFSVIRYDRRGHGASTDGPTWSFRREVEDLLELGAALADGTPMSVLGYSFGGAIALEAAREPGRVERLVVYEPPYGVAGMIEHAPDILALLEQDRRDEAARLFITRTFHVNDRLVEAMSHHPMWQVSLDVLPNLMREVPVVVASATPPPHPQFPPTRTLVAESGGNPGFRTIARALEDALGAHTVAVPGAPHFAMATAPETFAEVALAHLAQREPTSPASTEPTP